VKFGYFDDKNKEYVITRPDTPRPWSNYLGSTEYGAIITNHAGGYSFLLSAARGRFMRLYFNAVPLYQPGRLLYIRDNEKKDFWSASWMPAPKDPAKFTYECRHGTAYTVITSKYRGIATEATYFVPLDKWHEVWLFTVRNTTKRRRDLSVFTYAEFAGDWNVREDLIDLQFSQYTIKSDMVDGIINTGYLRNLPPDLPRVKTPDQGRNSFFTVVGAEVAGFDTRREVFVGNYRTYANPEVVEHGACTGSLAHGDNACAAMQVNLELAPGEQREFFVLCGVGSAERWGKPIREEFSSAEKVKDELAKVKAHWHGMLGGFSVKTPDAAFDSMVNVWGAYNCLITYAWSRAASLVYQGERDGLGYRDTVQDMLGVAGLIPETAQQRLELMITGQVSTGGAMPVVDPIAHKPGTNAPPRHYRDDDCMWLFNTIPEFVKETGELSWYDRVLPYADRGEATVLGHLRRAIEFNLEHTGAHGLPGANGTDWNDCIGLGKDGESFFVAFQLRYALTVYMDICTRLGRPEELAWAQAHRRQLDEILAREAWDGKWWRRGIRSDGTLIGSDSRDEGKIFLEPQPWAVIAEVGNQNQRVAAMDSVAELLATEYGVMLCAPPFRKDHSCGAVLFNAGQKENAGIFQHPQGWVVIAEAMLGRGEKAYEYFRAYMPSAANESAEVREAEPYVYCQSTHGRYSRMFGKARLPWLSGTASWSYYAATHYLVGVRPEYDGVTIDPCVPKTWKEFSVTRRFRGKMLVISVTNAAGVEKGVKSITVNGKAVNRGTFIPMDALTRDTNRIVVVMG